jgi:hypothetical protein
MIEVTLDGLLSESLDIQIMVVRPRQKELGSGMGIFIK